MISRRSLRLAAPLLLLVLALNIQEGTAASIFDAFTSSVSSLFTEQEEVKYHDLVKREGYEERRYPAQAWVCKTHNGTLTQSAQQSAFLTLFGYLAGENVGGVAIDMAVPVSVEAPVSTSVRRFEACFYPGKDHQTNTPKPTDRNVYIKTRPEMTIFTRRFSGFASTEATWRAETEKLQKLLEAGGENTLVGANIFWNAYDSPVKFWSRRNEVWIPKKK